MQPEPGEQSPHLDHLVGVGVVEHQLGERGAAGWKENHQMMVSVITESLYTVPSIL